MLKLTQWQEVGLIPGLLLQKPAVLHNLLLARNWEESSPHQVESREKNRAGALRVCVGKRSGEFGWGIIWWMKSRRMVVDRLMLCLGLWRSDINSWATECCWRFSAKTITWSELSFNVSISYIFVVTYYIYIYIYIYTYTHTHTLYINHRISNIYYFGQCILYEVDFGSG